MRGFSTNAAAIQSGWWFLEDPARNCQLEIISIPSFQRPQDELGFSSSTAMPSHHNNTRVLAPWQQSLALLDAGYCGVDGELSGQETNQTPRGAGNLANLTRVAGLHTAWGARAGTPKIRKPGLSIPGKYLCTRILQVRENGLAVMQASGIAHATEAGQIGTKWLGKGPERPWTGKTNPQWIRTRPSTWNPCRKLLAHPQTELPAVA